MTRIAVIPARYGSSRLPGKPLRKIGVHPLIEHVYRATTAACLFDEVVVATDDERIAEVVDGFGGVVELTDAGHETGTERVAEVAARRPSAEVVVNVQGDQPFVTRAALTSLISPFSTSEKVQIATLARVVNPEEAMDPNVVKVVCDLAHRALYFSRSFIPYDQRGRSAAILHHLGLYAFQKDALLDFARLPPTPLEQAEGLEQLRALENGYQIQVTETTEPLVEVNTLADLERANAQLAG